MITNKDLNSVLVIGGAGYIGSHIVLELCDKGYNVTVFDNLSSGKLINVDSRADFVNGSILSEKDLKEVFKKEYSAVFHFAALKSASESMESPEKYSKINIIGTINVLNAMLQNKVKNFIFSSSAAVYGVPQYIPVDEKHPLNPINYYGFTKLEIERYLEWYSELKGLNYAALRYFNAAGYDFSGKIKGKESNPANLLPIVFEVAAGIRSSMVIYGNDYKTVDGTCIRDYIHVSDLAEAHLAALEYLFNENCNLILNLATGKGSSVLEVINTIEEITQRNIAYSFVNRRLGDPQSLVSVSNSALDKISWEPTRSSLKDIVRSMWNIYS